tara:strand:- start:1613 stop:2686 length:1074 start_codon:yes stop_codon:yes gene_type:complete
MSYYNNKKLNYLLKNVFNNFECDTIRNSLISINIDFHIKSKEYDKYKPTQLEIDYPIRSFFKKKTISSSLKINQNIELTEQNRVKPYTKISEKPNIYKSEKSNINVGEKPNINKNLLNEINGTKDKKEIIDKKPLQKSIKNSKDSKKYIGMNILNNIIDDNMMIIELSKTDDYYSNIFFSSICSDFSILSIDEKKDFIKKIKLEIITKFSKENYYRDCDYSTKLFKKSELDEVFSFNKNITVSMLKVYADVFNTNCVYIYNNNIEFLNKFNKSNATILIEETNQKIYTLVKPKSYIRGSECEELGINAQFSKSTLSTFKLDKLQNIAKMYNLNIRKKGKVGKVNISRDELIEMMSID